MSRSRQIDRRVHHVDRVELRRTAGRRARSRSSGFTLSSATWPAYSISTLVEVALGELAGEAAELLGELHIGLEPRRFLGRERRHVDRVHRPRRSAGNPTSARRSAAPRSPAPRWSRRRDAACDHVVAAEQDVALGRLDREHVDRRAGDMAAIERRLQILLDHQAAARAIDDAHALLASWPAPWRR